MAATKGVGAGTISRMIGWLAIPRVVTLPLLIVLGAGLGELAWRFIDNIKIWAWMSGMVSPFCMMCATAVWVMRDRIDDIIDTEQMSSGEYQQFERLVLKHRTRSTYWATSTAMMALVASAPAVSSQLTGVIWQWMVLGCGAAAGGAVHAYLLTRHWETQIRAYRSQKLLSAKQQRERQNLLGEIAAGAGSLSDTGWIESPPLDPPARHH
jgi:hypothetical protein